MMIIAPSILSADFGAMRSQVQEAEQAGCRLLHVDVMDGHFVPNITMGPDMVAMLSQAVNVPLDVHLMIEEPERFLSVFYEAGLQRKGSILTVHYEACPHIHRVISQIHRLGDGKVLAGCALNPGTPVSVLRDLLPDLDLVLIMTVDPGFGGQAAIESCLDKVRQVKEMADKLGQTVLIEVDGGIKLDNLERVQDADIVVMGSAVFNERGAGANLQAIQKKLENLAL